MSVGQSNASKFVPKTPEEFIWFFQQRGEFNVRVDDAANTVIVNAEHHSMHLPINRGKLAEAHDLVRRLLAERGIGFTLGQGDMNALFGLFNPFFQPF
jgi:hypothetical protein